MCVMVLYNVWMVYVRACVHVYVHSCTCVECPAIVALTKLLSFGRAVICVMVEGCVRMCVRGCVGGCVRVDGSS